MIAPSEYVSKYVSKSDKDFWLAGGPLFRGTDGVLSGCREHDDRAYSVGGRRYGLDSG